MSFPHPTIIHQLPGRLRLYTPALRQNEFLGKRLENYLQNQINIINCTANPSSGRLLIKYNPSTYSTQQLCNLVCSYLQQSPLRRPPVSRTHRQLFEPESMPIPTQMALVAVGGIALLYHLFRHVRRRGPMPRRLERNMSFITLLTALPILRSGFEHLFFHRKLNNDLLIAAATILSLFLREGATGLIVVWLVNLSTLLETLTLDHSRRAIRSMLEGTEKNTWLLVDNQEVSVPIHTLKKGDIIIVKVGSKIPVDGIVAHGTALVNQAALTGEPVPVVKQPSDSVWAGSTIEEGTLQVRAEKVGDDTSVASIIHLVETASHTRAPIQNIADTYAAKIIPASFLLALLVFLLTRDIQRTVTILIVACPCAAGLATPTALSAAIGNAASRGILIKGGRHLEEAGRVDVMLFDKTGTLTAGCPTVSRVIPLDPHHSERSILSLAATAESNANHPLAKAVVEAAKNAGVVIQHQPNSEMTIGKGVRAIIDHRPVYVGSDRFMLDIGVPLADDLSSSLTSMEPEATILYIALESTLIGALHLKDALRSHSDDALQRLRAEGVTDIGLVSGDNKTAAEQVAHTLGITRVYSSMLPQDKFQLVKKLKKEGFTVGMVGDGINDSPALALANVGIAMGAGGTDTAIETAGIVLRNDDPRKIAEVIHLGKHTLNIIRQNFLFAIGANIIGLALGSAKYISPFMAALLHNASTLGVVLNSTRLLTYNPHKEYCSVTSKSPKAPQS